MKLAGPSKGETTDANPANVLVIDVPGALGGGRVVFANSHIHFKNKEIPYQDIETMSFHAVNQSVNLIPVSQTYSFMIASASTKISFKLGSTLHIGKKASRMPGPR
jgi:hypothetical protein